MICQDDNFTDLARGYGQLATQLVAVPTHDWREVANYHFENSRMRPLENRYAVIRAAIDGVSAIVSARGEVLAQTDHFGEGARVTMANVPVYPGGSTYSGWGSWPIGILSGLIVVLSIARGTYPLRRRRAIS